MAQSLATRNATLTKKVAELRGLIAGYKAQDVLDHQWLTEAQSDVDEYEADLAELQATLAAERAADVKEDAAYEAEIARLKALVPPVVVPPVVVPPTTTMPYPVAVAGSGAPSGLPIPAVADWTLDRWDDFATLDKAKYTLYDGGPSKAHADTSWWSANPDHLYAKDGVLNLVSFKDTAVKADGRQVSAGASTGKKNFATAELLVLWASQSDKAKATHMACMTYGSGSWPACGENDIVESGLGAAQSTSTLHYLRPGQTTDAREQVGKLDIDLTKWTINGARYTSVNGVPKIEFLTSAGAPSGAAFRVWKTVSGAQYAPYLLANKRLIFQTEATSLTYDTGKVGLRVDWWASYVRAA